MYPRESSLLSDRSKRAGPQEACVCYNGAGGAVTVFCPIVMAVISEHSLPPQNHHLSSPSWFLLLDSQMLQLDHDQRLPVQGAPLHSW
jgi:hypothetical protein